MKLQLTCLSASKDGEISFHYCGSPVKLVQVRFCAGITIQRHFSRRGGAVKDVQACLSARKDRESSFHNCGGPVKLVQACVCAANTLHRRFDRRAGDLKHIQVWFMSQYSLRKQFSPLWRSCESRVSLFMCMRKTHYNSVLAAEEVL